MSKVFHQLTTLWLKTWLSAVVVSEANNSVADEWQMNPDVTQVHERGTWQLCHVRRLAFPLNISFYLIWRCKFRILRIKKTRTKIGTLRISHTSSRLDLRKTGAITDKVWWLCRAYKCSPRRGFRWFFFCLYLAKLLLLNLYMILWSQFRVFAHSASLLYWCQH